MVKKACTLTLVFLLLGLFAGDCMGSDFQNEMLYSDFKADYFLGVNITEVVEALGEPSYDDYFQGAHCYGYNDYEILFMFDDNTSVVTSIYIRPYALKLGSVTFDKNRSELIEVLGEPDKIDSYYSDIDEEFKYIMSYNRMNHIIDFELRNPNDKAYIVGFKPIQND